MNDRPQKLPARRCHMGGCAAAPRGSRGHSGARADPGIDNTTSVPRRRISKGGFLPGYSISMSVSG